MLGCRSVTALKTRDSFYKYFYLHNGSQGITWGN